MVAFYEYIDVFGFDQRSQGLLQEVRIPSNAVVKRQCAFRAGNGDALQRRVESREKSAGHDVGLKIDVFDDLWLQSADAANDVLFQAPFELIGIGGGDQLCSFTDGV